MANESAEISLSVESSELTDRCLLDLPDEIIEDILSNLDPQSRLLFGETCSRISNILNNKAKLWQDVWVNVASLIKSEYTPTLKWNRKYANATWDISPIVKLSKDEIRELMVMRLATAILGGMSTIKSLHLACSETLSIEGDQSFYAFLCALNMFSGMSGIALTHLKIEARYDPWRIRERLTPAPEKKKATITLDHLKELKIPVELMYVLIEYKFAEFTTSSLGSLVTSAKEDSFDPSQRFKNTMLELIKRQKNLSKLVLPFDIRFLFDQQLRLQSRLQTFDCYFDKLYNVETFSSRQQDNFVDFLHSQSELKTQGVDFSIHGICTPRLLDYRMKILQQDTKELILFITPDEGESTIISLCDFTIEELGRLAHEDEQPNRSVVSLSFDSSYLENINGPQHELWVAGIANKFPNLRHLKLNLDLDINSSTISLASLGALTDLSHFQLGAPHLKLLLRNVTLPSLTKFECDISLKHEAEIEFFVLENNDFNELESFLNRQTMLTELKLVLINQEWNSDGELKEEESPESLASVVAAVELIQFAMENLEELMTMEVKGLCFNESQLEHIRSVMVRHAKIGFRLVLVERMPDDVVLAKERRILTKLDDGSVSSMISL